MLYQFWIPFIVLLACVLICERRWCMLRDQSKVKKAPFSWSKVQLAWWTIIILSSFIAVMWKGGTHTAPTLSYSVVILLGISAATIATARVIDVSDNTLALESKGETFLLDILSDHTGVSISRFQTIIFNLVFGVWFIAEVLNKLGTIPPTGVDAILPIISYPNLALLGLSSATYTALKSTENKAAVAGATEQMQLASDGSVG